MKDSTAKDWLKFFGFLIGKTSAEKIMNVQMLPWLAQAVIHGQINNAKQQADRVADDLFALLSSERPDVIVFNEVFDEG